MTSSHPFTYPEVGATRRGPLPAGYRHLSYRARIGVTATLPTAAEALLTWRMHRRAGVRMDASAARAAAGVRVVPGLGIGPLRISAPCQVVWTVHDRDRIGFGYGTLPGHPVHGEESFVLNVDDEGTVWLTITSFSRPARWFMRAAGPVAPLLQQQFARRCARALRRLVRPGTSGGPGGPGGGAG